jgi:hypothetical protein
MDVHCNKHIAESLQNHASSRLCIGLMNVHCNKQWDSSGVRWDSSVILVGFTWDSGACGQGAVGLWENPVRPRQQGRIWEFSTVPTGARCPQCPVPQRRQPGGGACGQLARGSKKPPNLNGRGFRATLKG